MGLIALVVVGATVEVTAVTEGTAELSNSLDRLLTSGLMVFSLASPFCEGLRARLRSKALAGASKVVTVGAVVAIGLKKHKKHYLPIPSKHLLIEM